MAEVKFLADLNVDGNLKLKAGAGEIHNASFQILTADPTTNNFEGRMIYRSDTDEIKFYDGSSWNSLTTSSGDITRVNITAGTGLSGTQDTTSGDHTQTLAIDLSEYSAVTPTSGDKLLTLDSDGSTEQLTTTDALATLFAGSGLTATNGVIAVDTLNQNTTGSAATLATGRTIGMTGDVVWTSAAFDGSGNVTGTATIQADAVEGSMLNDNVISGQTALTTGLASTDELMVSDAGTLKRMDVSVIQSYMQSNLTFTTNTDTVDMGDGFVIEDGDGTEVTITENKEVKFVEGSNININWTDTSNGSDTDPYDLTFAVGTSADTTDADQFLMFTANQGEEDFRVDGTGTSDLTYNPSTQTLKVNNIVVAGTQTINDTTLINTSNGILFEGATADAFETKLVATDPTADRTITLKNASGTLAFTSDLPSTATSSANGTARVSAGDGIDVSVSSGNFTVSADLKANGGLVIESTEIAVDLGASSITGTLAISDGGTGATTASAAFTALKQDATTSATGVVELATAAEALAGSNSTKALVPSSFAAREFTATIGDGTATSIDVTHSLGTRNVMVQMFDSSSYETVYAEVNRSTTDAVNIRFNSAPATNDVTVLITKVG